MDPITLGKLATDLGVLAALVLWFTWQASVREDRMLKRLETLESYIRDTMTRALDANTEVMSRLEDWLQQREVADKP